MSNGARPAMENIAMRFHISAESSRLEQIYFHASRLFIEKGFSATSMSDIADAVGITKAGLYHFINNKEELLFTLMNWGMDVLERDVREPANLVEDPAQRLRVIVRGHLENISRVATEYGNPFTVIMDEPSGLVPEKANIIRGRKREYFNLVRNCMAELKNNGQLANDDPTVSAFGVLGTILWFGRWHRPDGPLGADALVSQLTDMCLRSALTHEAYETLSASLES